MEKTVSHKVTEQYAGSGGSNQYSPKQSPISVDDDNIINIIWLLLTWLNNLVIN